MLSRNQSQECRIGISLSKTLKVSGLHNQGQCSVRTDSQETAQLLHIFLIACFGSYFFDPLIVTFDLRLLFLIRCQILVQRLPVYQIEFQSLQPGDMPDGPFRPGIQMPMPKDKRIDLLLQLLKCQLIVIPHPKVLL